MKLNFLWSTPALAAALWLGGSALSASAQSIDAGGEAAAGAATDAAAGSAADTGAAATTTDTAAGAAGAADASATSSGAADASAATDASADTDTVQPSAQSTISGEAATSADAQTATPPAQPSASADISADAAAATSPSAAAQPQTPGATSPDAAATAGTEVDASIQGDPNLRAGAQIDAQRNLNLQQGLQFGQATDRGLAINTIARDHFFFNSGLRSGDTLVSYAGRPIRSQADFNRWVVFQPGQRVPVVVLRNGRPQTIHVVYQQQQSLEHQAGYAPAAGGAYLGVTFDAQNPQQAIVRTVSPGSPAERAGIRPGDAIFAVNGNQVGGSQDVIRIVSSMQPGEPIDVAISRQVVLGSRPGVAQAAAYSPDVRIQGSVAPQPAPAVPAVPAPAVVGDTTVDDDAVAVPGSGRFDNTPARAGDVDRDGRLLDADGRVGPVEGRAILPRRRN
jgi:hypothetical protein